MGLGLPAGAAEQSADEVCHGVGALCGTTLLARVDKHFENIFHGHSFFSLVNERKRGIHRAFRYLYYSDVSLEEGLLSVVVLSFFSFVSFFSDFFLWVDSPEGDLWSVA